MQINQAKDIVIKAGKELVARGLIARTWGNVSQKVDEHTMVITPSGRDYQSLTREDILAVNIETLAYEGDVKPSSEKAVHASCYKQKDVDFVIHTHQLYASVVSACGIDGFETSAQYPLLSHYVVAAGYGLPSTKKLNKNIEKALAKTTGNAIVMKHHGALCFGKDYKETFEAAMQLEDASKAYIEQKYLQVSGEKQADPMEMAKFVLAKHGIKPEKMQYNGFDLEDKQNSCIINASQEVVALSHMKKAVRPMVDDFAQIVGVKMRASERRPKAYHKALEKADAVFIAGKGAICAGPNMDDAKAVSMIVEKNCKAFIGASLHGKAKPINRFESRLMRMIYKMKYSKQMSQ